MMIRSPKMDGVFFCTRHVVYQDFPPIADLNHHISNRSENCRFYKLVIFCRWGRPIKEFYQLFIRVRSARGTLPTGPPRRSPPPPRLPLLLLAASPPSLDSWLMMAFSEISLISGCRFTWFLFPMELRRCGGEAAAAAPRMASWWSLIYHIFPVLSQGFGCNKPQNFGSCVLWILELSSLSSLCR